MNAAAERIAPAPHAANHTSRSRCPRCGQTLPAIPNVPAATCATTPVKQYVLERRFGVKRMNSGFV